MSYWRGNRSVRSMRIIRRQRWMIVALFALAAIEAVLLVAVALEQCTR
jgi:hypothetical protein